MGTTLVQRGVPLVSLYVQHAGGTLWRCPAPCGVQPIQGEDRGPSRFVELRDVLVEGQHAHHGFLYVGRLTASPPASTLSAVARE